MAKGKKKKEKPETVVIEKPKKPVSYRVTKALWLRNIHRHPGYILDQEDIGYLNSKGIFDHVLDKLKAIEEV